VSETVSDSLLLLGKAAVFAYLDRVAALREIQQRSEHCRARPAALRSERCGGSSCADALVTEFRAVPTAGSSWRHLRGSRRLALLVVPP
jgi:hypothetical protein